MGRPKLYASPTERKRAQRARDRASAAHRLDAPGRAVSAVVDHADPVGALSEWAASTLRVPPGHARVGEPMILLPFAQAWLRDGWDAHESALTTARKNAKSAVCAILALGYLCGPLRRPGWRGAIASVGKEKAGELRRQVAEIASASNLDVRIRRSPYPGIIESSTGSFDTLSADRMAGHASGYDLCVVDETGLFPLRARDLLAGLRSSVSAKDGKIRHISIRGDSPLFAEILSESRRSRRASTPRLTIARLAMSRRGRWPTPRSASIKSAGYMKNEVARVQQGCPVGRTEFSIVGSKSGHQPDARNGLQSPDDLRSCFADSKLTCRGPAYVGLDIGEAGSRDCGGRRSSRCNGRAENLARDSATCRI